MIDLLRILLAQAVKNDLVSKVKSRDGKTLYYLKPQIDTEPVKK